MKAILFNDQQLPQIGDKFVVVDCYVVNDHINGPRMAVMLEKVGIPAKIEFDEEAFKDFYRGQELDG